MKILAVIAFVAATLGVAASARAEILVRWDQTRVPALDALGLSSLLIPIERIDAIRDAAQKGYRVYAEVDATRLATLTVPSMVHGGVVVRGQATAAQLRRLRVSLGRADARVLTLDERGKWPHVRLNAVAKRNNVLQVASRTAQPWLENNGALVRIAELESATPTPLLTYPWSPLTVSEQDEGPSVEHYLVAIAEAGSLGASLVLPLHEGFQKALLSGRPDARREWAEIRQYIEFYAWDVPRDHERLASVGVITADPLASFETLNLLTRHNVPFRLLRPADVTSRALDDLALFVVLSELDATQTEALAAVESRGATVLRPGGPAVDPNGFALDVRNRLGPAGRVVDVWNGITVLVSPYRDAADGMVMLGVVNYAHEARPVQMRVQGTFTSVQVETPGEAATLVPYTHRNGDTEFVLPGLRVGARVFLAPGRDATPTTSERLP